MKVNVTGRGFIPGLNSIAPVYNREIDVTGIKRILNFKQFRVFFFSTGIIITKKNIDSFNVVKKPVEKVTKEPEKVNEPVTEEIPVVEPEETIAPVTEDVVDEVQEPVEEEALVEETIDSDTEVVTDEITESVDETVETEETGEEIEDSSNNDNVYHGNNKKNRNKNKHRNNN